LKPNWANLTKTDQYIGARYYDQILKVYSALGLEDLEFLRLFIKKNKYLGRVLELGCGTGRATDIILKNSYYKDILATDLSEEMIKHAKKKYRNKRRISYKISDHLDFLSKTNEKFDTVISLWSLGHSIDPWYLKYYPNSEKIITSKLYDFFDKNLNSQGKIFFIHTDWNSEEQKIRRECRLLNDKNDELKYYKYSDSPSMRICCEVFSKLIKKKIFIKEKTKIYKLFGDDIIYSSIEEAIEVFMNFHMEGEFNNSNFESSYKFLHDQFEHIIEKKGNLAIGTGFWIFEGCKY